MLNNDVQIIVLTQRGKCACKPTDGIAQIQDFWYTKGSYLDVPMKSRPDYIIQFSTQQAIPCVSKKSTFGLQPSLQPCKFAIMIHVSDQPPTTLQMTAKGLITQMVTGTGKHAYRIVKTGDYE